MMVTGAVAIAERRLAEIDGKSPPDTGRPRECQSTQQQSQPEQQTHRRPTPWASRAKPLL